MRGRVHSVSIYRADDFVVTTDAKGRWSADDPTPEVVMGKVTPATDMPSLGDDHKTLSAIAYIPAPLRRPETDDQVVVGLAPPRDCGRYRVARVEGGVKVLALYLERYERKDSTDAQ